MRHRLWIGGQWQSSEALASIHSPFTGEIVSQADQASADLLEQALSGAKQASAPFRTVSRFTRSRLLFAMARRIAERRQEFVNSIVNEAGKPISLAEAELSRALSTFTIGAEEAKRYGGELFPLDIEAASRAYDIATSILTPRGVVLAITPFNFPLNLVAHKVVPALAVGAPVLIKPAPQTPGPTALLAEVFAAAREEVNDSRDIIPEAALQTISCSNEIAGKAVCDPRIATLSFTGSASVGWMLQGMARGKRVILELGGNASVIVHKDADLERAAKRCVFGAFAYAGQVCISVQNILVHRDIYSAFRQALEAELKIVKCGDPMQKDTLVGPMVNAAAADRLMTWIAEAKSAGATISPFGGRVLNTLPPTLVEGTPKTCQLAQEEAFGPVVLLDPYENLDEAIARVNASRYGLQTGIFTDSHSLIRKAIEEIESGGILINEVPTFRADHMPYGGVKDSGLGREGVRYAMEEYSERKTVIAWKG